MWISFVDGYLAFRHIDGAGIFGSLGANREMHSACTVWEISDAFLAMLYLPTIFCLQDYSQWYIFFNLLCNLSGF